MPIFDYTKLNDEIVKQYGNKTNFAIKNGISKSLISLKLNNKVSFTSKDIIEISKTLNIPKKEIGTFFFTIKL